MRKIHRHTAAARLYGVRSSMVERLNPISRPSPILRRFTGPARRSDDPAVIGTPLPRWLRWKSIRLKPGARGFESLPWDLLVDPP